MKKGLSRRRFVGIAATAFAAVPLIGRSERGAAMKDDAFEIGLVADPQYADIPPRGTRFYRESLVRLAEAVDHFNHRDLAFCVNVGDLIDRDFVSFDPMLAAMAKSRHTWHHVLGNHDFEVSEADKPGVPTRLGMKARYGSFDARGFTFVVLDTNDVSTYAHLSGSRERAEGDRELQRLLAAGERQAKPWNGGVGAAQLAWFERTCRQAAETRRRIIVFAHQPVLPETEYVVWNAKSVQEVVERNRNVVAWINGHHHAGGFAEHAGVPFVTLCGMVETKDTTAFATAKILPDRMLITGHGREPSRELVFPRAAR